MRGQLKQSTRHPVVLQDLSLRSHREGVKSVFRSKCLLEGGKGGEGSNSYSLRVLKTHSLERLLSSQGSCPGFRPLWWHLLCVVSSPAYCITWESSRHPVSQSAPSIRPGPGRCSLRLAEHWCSLGTHPWHQRAEAEHSPDPCLRALRPVLPQW